MITDKLREVQLVAESKVLKIDAKEQYFSRFDKTVYMEEPIPDTITLTSERDEDKSIGYVEASKFFALFGEAKQVVLKNDYCFITLKNGAEYKLPYFDIFWDRKQYDVEGASSVKLKLAAGRLSSATLKNLANPMLQCIYVDEATAVSCNSMVACIDGTVHSSTPLILPPDIISIIEGSETEIFVAQGAYVIKLGSGIICVPIPELDYKDTADTLRDNIPENIKTFPVKSLADSLKRLSASHEYVVFTGDKVKADEDFEPFEFPTANPEYMYNIQNLLSIIGQTQNIAQGDYPLFLYGDKFLFMVSPETDDTQEAEEAAAE